MNKNTFSIVTGVALFVSVAIVAGVFMPQLRLQAAHAQVQAAVEEFVGPIDEGEVRHVAIDMTVEDEEAAETGTISMESWWDSNNSHTVFAFPGEPAFSAMAIVGGNSVETCIDFSPNDREAVEELFIDDEEARNQLGTCTQQEREYYLDVTDAVAIDNIELFTTDEQPESIFFRFQTTDRLFEEARMASVTVLQTGNDMLPSLQHGNASEDAPDHLRYLNKQEDGVHKHSFELRYNQSDIDTSKPLYVQFTSYSGSHDRYNTDAFELVVDVQSIRKLSPSEVAALQTDEFAIDDSLDTSFMESLFMETLIALQNVEAMPVARTKEIINGTEYAVIEYRGSDIETGLGDYLFDTADAIRVYLHPETDRLVGYAIIEHNVVAEQVLLRVAEVIEGVDSTLFFSEEEWHKRNTTAFARLEKSVQ